LNQKTTDREILQVELAEPGPDRIWALAPDASYAPLIKKSRARDT